MSQIISIRDAFERWEADIKPEVIAQYGADDMPAMSESWNDYTDSLCEDGELTDLQYDYCPAWDDDMPDSDISGDCAFILEAMGVTFHYSQLSARPDGAGDWVEGATHWKVTVTRDGLHEFSIYYSMGPAHFGMPDDCGVFACLLRDSSAGTDDFEDFCSEFGYDTDSRKAYGAWQACQETEANMGQMFTMSELSDLSDLFNEAGF